MSLVRRVLGLDMSRVHTREDLWGESVGWLSTSGNRVDADTAMSISAVWSAVRLVSEAVAMLPLHMYRRRADGGKENARDHPVEDLLARTPNRWQNALEFREMMQGHVELRGNAYARILPGPRGAVDQLVPVHPDRVVVEQDDDGSPLYRVQSERGGEEILLQHEMFHLRGLSSDGLSGLSPLAYARNSFGLTIATEEYGSRSFSQGVRPSGVLEAAKELSDNAFKRLKAEWNASYGGVQNTGKTVILEEGMKWQQIGMTSEDAQFLESRKFQINEIARWFHVPPHMLGDLERATFSNIEEQGLEFVVYSLMGRLKRWEAAIARSLITRDDVFYAEHNVDGLLRGNVEARWRAYAIALNWSCMSPDEVRARENMNPLPDGLGQIYMRPLNMVPAGTEVNQEMEASIARHLALLLQDSAIRERAERNGHVHIG